MWGKMQKMSTKPHSEHTTAVAFKSFMDIIHEFRVKFHCFHRKVSHTDVGNVGSFVVQIKQRDQRRRKTSQPPKYSGFAHLKSLLVEKNQT